MRFTRTFRLALLISLLAALTALTPAVAQSAPQPKLASAKALGKAKSSCAAKARKATKAMKGASRRARMLRARSIRSKCNARGTKKPAAPLQTSLTIGIDGGHDEWWSDTINAREEFGAAITRHEWDPPREAVDAKDELVYVAATEVHTRIHALIGGNDIGDGATYRNWVVAFVQRYGPGGAFWAENPELDAGRYAITSIELGNEPYFGEMSPTEYATAVRPTLEALAQMGSPVKVILPSYIHGERTTWMDTLYREIPNLNELFYAFADHPYWYGHNPAEDGDSGPFDRLDTLRERMNFHGATDKPIYITEYGESTANCGEECVSEATQAEHLREMINAVATRGDWGVELLSLFQLHDWATDSTNREQQFGLLRHDETPKPSYEIVKQAVEQYRG